MVQMEIRADRAGTVEVRRVARACIARAHRMLDCDALSDSAVHQARKEIKKSRAAVRLLRESLGIARYRKENERLRNASRALNAVRDARVLVRTLDELRERDPHLSADAAVTELARRLRASQRMTRRQLRQPTATLFAASRTLGQTQFSASQWPVGRHGWAKLGPAFRRIYAAGRSAAGRSRSAHDDKVLHEWRKHVKYLWHALQVFQPLRPQKLRKHARLTRRLADDLGQGHDLAVLRDCALGAGRSPGLALRPLLEAIDQRSRDLHARALQLSERVYADTPQQIDKRLGRYWHRWRAQRP